jgi:hypothetical protein
MNSLASSALTALKGPRFSPQEALARAQELQLNRPGLYAVYGDEQVWLALGLGTPPDGRPLYVGKAQDDLASRDLRQHFASGETGRSTLRRTLASLLRRELNLIPHPRGTNPLDSTTRANLFKLESAGEARLTRWMNEALRLAFWPIKLTNLSALGAVEGEIIRELEPPLCLNKWSDTTWRPQIKRARGEMVDMVRDKAHQEMRSSDSSITAPDRRAVTSRPDPDVISTFLQRRLKNLECDSTTAVEAAQWLDLAGILTDSQDRPGRPLRVLLREGRIKGQRQEPNGRWHIHRIE